MSELVKGAKTDKVDSEKRVRKTIDFPVPEEKQLVELASELGITQVELIRRAVKAYTKSEELREAGYSPGVHRVEKDGSIKIVEFLY